MAVWPFFDDAICHLSKVSFLSIWDIFSYSKIVLFSYTRRLPCCLNDVPYRQCQWNHKRILRADFNCIMFILFSYFYRSRQNDKGCFCFKKNAADFDQRAGMEGEKEWKRRERETELERENEHCTCTYEMIVPCTWTNELLKLLSYSGAMLTFYISMIWYAMVFATKMSLLVFFI